MCSALLACASQRLPPGLLSPPPCSRGTRRACLRAPAACFVRRSCPSPCPRRSWAAPLSAGRRRRRGEQDGRARTAPHSGITRPIYPCAHNPFVESALNEYYTLSLRIWFLALDRVAQLDDAVTEHRELLQAICDGDAARAENVMRRHIQSFERSIRAVL